MLQPDNDSWAAVVYDSIDAAQTLGSAMLIDGYRLLTCLHVATGGSAGDQVWVSFPKAVGLVRRQLWLADVYKTDSDLDVALLRLVELVPPGVAPAPLRCPTPRALVGNSWWAFGFAQSRRGNATHGTVGESLGDGFVRLDADQATPYRLRAGFSGAGVWSEEFDAVVAMVVGSDEHGNGEAVTVHQLDLHFPEEGISDLTRWAAGDAGDVALSAWSLRTDQEASRHWSPRARGVSIDSERGFRFRGRRAALRSIAGWLDREAPDRRALVVTGSPGMGKSAVLGRIVTTADASVRRQLPADDTAMRASVGSVSCAVHVKGKTALEVATEIARAASAELPGRPEDLAPALRETLAIRAAGRPRFNVVIDALDEATSPMDARSVVTHVVLALVETCADLGVQVVVGTRRSDDEGVLLRLFGAALDIIDLDDPQFFEESDLESYTLATLQLLGDERAGNPYATAAAAWPLAQRIASLSERNFLIAGLVARAHGLHDDTPVEPEALTFTPTVDSALREYLRRLEPVGGLAADALLTALAFAKSPGLPLRLWQAAMDATTGRAITTAELTRFARSSAANFLIESNADSERPTPTFRLFHQALNDALLAARAQVVSAAEDERSLTCAFINEGRSRGWGSAPDYLLRSLPAHAVAAGMIDDLLTDGEYLLHAELRQLIPVGSSAKTLFGRRRARLLQLTPQAIAAGPAARIALFSVTEVLEGLERDYANWPQPTQFRALWASAVPRAEFAVLEGHSDAVHAVCAFLLGNRTLLASASSDMTVRAWDASSGSCELILHGHTAYVSGICAFASGDQILLASSSGDHTIRIWDAATGLNLRSLTGHGANVTSVCAFTSNGHPRLASGGGDHTVRIWDPASGELQRTLEGHANSVLDVCPVDVGGQTFIVSASYDRTIRIWDPDTGEHIRTLDGHTEPVWSIRSFHLDTRDWLASASGDHTVRIWDPLTGHQARAIDSGIEMVMAVCAFASGNRILLAGAASGGVMCIWDPATGAVEQTLAGQSIWLNGVCAFVLGTATMLASVDGDDTVRIWQIDFENEPRSPDDRPLGRYILMSVNSLCVFASEGHSRLASCHRTSVRISDPATGELEETLTGHVGWVSRVIPFSMAGVTLLATASYDETVRIWNPATGAQHAVLRGHSGRVEDVCSFLVGSRVLLGSAGDDGTVRIWDPGTSEQLLNFEHPHRWVECVCAVGSLERVMMASGNDKLILIWDIATGELLHELAGHSAGVNALYPLVTDREPLLASASRDTTVRLWDPLSGAHLRTLTGHVGAVNGLSATDIDGRTLMATASDDRTVRIWDVASGVCQMVIPVQHQATAVSWAAGAETLIIGLGSGLLTVRVDQQRLA